MTLTEIALRDEVMLDDVMFDDVMLDLHRVSGLFSQLRNWKLPSGIQVEGLKTCRTDAMQ